jgi:hypothetical protein
VTGALSKRDTRSGHALRLLGASSALAVPLPPRHLPTRIIATILSAIKGLPFMWGWLIETWRFFFLAIVGTAYMIGGYKPWPRVAMSLWALAVFWIVGGLLCFVYKHHELRKPSEIPGFWTPPPVPKWLMLVRSIPSRPPRK